MEGTLASIGGGKHVWLLAELDALLYPKIEIQSRDQHWRADIEHDVVVNNECHNFSLILMVVGARGEAVLRDWLNPPPVQSRQASLREIPDSAKLDVVPLTLKPLPVSSQFKATPAGPLGYIFPQADGGVAYNYSNVDAKVSYEYLSDPGCQRPNRQAQLRLSYDVGSADASGGWGVQWRSGPPGWFDASRFSRLVVWVKGGLGNETFELSLKDVLSNTIVFQSKERIVVTTSEWLPLTVELSEAQGLDLAHLETVAIGFNRSHGRGSIFVDEMSFL